MLELKNLKVTLKNKVIINDINMTISSGKTHVIMGPNGAGKSSLASVVAGMGGYHVSGQVILDGVVINDWNIEKRARAGIFLSFQNPIDLPGVSWISFLKEALNAKRIADNKEKITVVEFMKEVNMILDRLGLDKSLVKRSVNEGFSGGEKKKFEALQILLLKPKFVILDELDSGLDIDSLSRVACGIKDVLGVHTSFLVITHYHRLLRYFQPDVVHVMMHGNLLCSGGIDVANDIEKNGYDKYL